MTRTGTTPPASPSTAAPSMSAPTSYLLDAWLDLTGQHSPDIDSERWVSYNIDDLYPEWHQRAHCAGVGVDYYFGEDTDKPTMSIQQVRRASKLCDVCPVYYECLTWALTTREEYGVWAGTSGRVRRRIFKLLDTGTETLDQVIEVFRHGQGDRYRLPQADAPAKAAVITGWRTRHGRLRPVVTRQVAL